MKRILSLLCAVLMMPVAARAQQWDAAALIGYGLPIDLEHVSTAQIENATIAGGLSWYVDAGRLLTKRWSVEAEWSQQASGYDVRLDDRTGRLFPITMQQLHGNLVVSSADAAARTRLFAFAGVGATRLSATDLNAETHLSYALGVGMKVFPWRKVGFRTQAAYRLMFLNDENGTYCDPFGFCEGSIRQLEFAGGMSIRF